MRTLAPILTLLLLAACAEEPPAPRPIETEIPEELRKNAPIPPIAAEEAQLGNAMAERVATIGLLNKRNNLSQDLEMAPGDSRRVGDVIIRLAACEKTAPWERIEEEGAFVQVLVQDPGENADWRKVFSGWLFKNSPGVNVVEHPIYDVWVKDCAMSFPGEEEEPAPASESSEE